jgi:ABC-type uncharacterized transport system substrate-binding protein
VIVITKRSNASLCSGRDFVEFGGTMSCATDNAELHHQVGVCADRILKGENPFVPATDIFVMAITRQPTMMSLKANGDVEMTTVMNQADAR